MKVKACQASARVSAAARDMDVEIVDNPDMPRTDSETADKIVVGSVHPRPETCSRSRFRIAPAAEHGAWSGEFAFAILVLAIAVVAGGLGGVWIAKREGLRKPKATQPVQVTEQPSDQATKPPDAEKASEALSKTALPGKAEAGAAVASPGANSSGSKHSSLEGISYTSQAGITRVRIGMGTASLSRAAGLSNPERVYFDLEGAHDRLDALKTMTVTDDALLSGIRVARWRSGNTRVVLDLKRPCEFSYHLSPQPEQSLIVELKPRSAAGTGASPPESRKNN